MLRSGHWEVLVVGNVVQLPLDSTWILVLVSLPSLSPNVLVEFLVFLFDKLNWCLMHLKQHAVINSVLFSEGLLTDDQRLNKHLMFSLTFLSF